MVIFLVTMVTPIFSHVKDKNSVLAARDEDMIFSKRTYYLLIQVLILSELSY